MEPRDDVCVVVPTLNEAATIGEVVSGFQESGLSDVLVIDGGSTDGTVPRAEEHGAEVVSQTGSGKGSAVREALELVDAPIVVLVDGDGTYDPAEVTRLLEPIDEGRAEHVIGNRFAGLKEGAMSRLNRFGNLLINRAFRHVHGLDLGDVLSGYRAFTLDSTERFHLQSAGFGIETEFAVECAKLNIPTAVVPITYRSRPHGSDTNLHPIRDGAVIISTLYRLAKTHNPLFYFGSIGVVSLAIGTGLGAYIATEWFWYDVSHEVLSVVAGVTLLFGVQLLMFGVLSDMILSLHWERLRRIE